MQDNVSFLTVQSRRDEVLFSIDSYLSHIKLKRGRFPRVFGDKFGEKFVEKIGDSLNLVKTLVTNSVTKLVNHQIW